MDSIQAIRKEQIFRDTGYGRIQNDVLKLYLKSYELKEANSYLRLDSLTLHVYQKGHKTINGGASHGISVIEKPWLELPLQPEVRRDNFVTISKTTGSFSSFYFKLKMCQLDYNEQVSGSIFYSQQVYKNCIKIFTNLKTSQVHLHI